MAVVEGVVAVLALLVVVREVMVVAVYIWPCNGGHLC